MLQETIDYTKDNYVFMILLMFVIVSSCLCCSSFITPSQFDTSFGTYTDLEGNTKAIGKLPISFKCLSLDANYAPPCSESVPVTCNGMFIMNGNVIDAKGDKTEIIDVVTDQISLLPSNGIIYEIRLDNAPKDLLKAKVDSLN